MTDIRHASKLFLDFIYDNKIIPQDIEDLLEDKERLSSERRFKYDIRVILNLLKQRENYQPKNYYLQDIQNRCQSFKSIDQETLKWLRDSETIFKLAIDFCNEFFHNVSNNTGAETFISALDSVIKSAPSFYEKSPYLSFKHEVIKTSGESGQYGRAKDRIPKWAKKPTQYNHIIIWSYFKAEEMDGQATKTLMTRLCQDKGMTERQFYGNYAAMKSDNANNHGKVFEDDGERVYLWEEIKNTLMEYKSDFYKG